MLDVLVGEDLALNQLSELLAAEVRQLEYAN